MKIYIKNTDTNEILTLEAESYEKLSKNFRQSPYDLASDSEVTAHKLEEAKEAKISLCIDYLNKTDWYITRRAEVGEAMPDDIAANRINARYWQNITNEELDNININFE